VGDRSTQLNRYTTHNLSLPFDKRLVRTARTPKSLSFSLALSLISKPVLLKVQDLNDVIFFNDHLSRMHNLKIPLIDNTTTESGDSNLLRAPGNTGLVGSTL
jgi:hypothetical protein